MENYGNSLLLLAVKRATRIGASNLCSQNKYEDLKTGSDYGVNYVDKSDMEYYINELISQSCSNLPSTFQDMKQQIVESFEIARDFMPWEEFSSNMVCQTFYSNNNGKLYFYNYCFTPTGKGSNIIQCELLSFDVIFRLADICVTLTKVKKNWYRKKSYVERRYIKPAVSNSDYMVALSIAVAPLLGGMPVQTPKNAAQELIEMAAEVPDTIPSDAPRRTVYNPYKKMNVVITDPTILKLLPGRWEIIRSRDNPTVDKNSRYWRFEY